MRKTLIGLVCFSLLMVIILPVYGHVVTNRTSPSTSYKNFLYVGGSGAGNYSSIQEAIDDASDGDTVFVYDDSAPYRENVIVHKSIKLIGENKNKALDVYMQQMVN